MNAMDLKWPTYRVFAKPFVQAQNKENIKASMFSLIWAWTNGWVNIYKASDLRRHWAHYDVTVMFKIIVCNWNKTLDRLKYPDIIKEFEHTVQGCWRMMGSIEFHSNVWYMYLSKEFHFYTRCLASYPSYWSNSSIWLIYIDDMLIYHIGAPSTSKCIFLNENIWIPFSQKFVPKVRINNIPALVPIMAWRRPGDKQLSEPMMFSLLTNVRIYASLGLNELK